MSRWLPPLCLVTALATLIAGFALLAVSPPEASVRLHKARVAGDEQHRDLLEAELERQKLRRRTILGALFGSSALLTAAAFLSMSSPSQSAPRDSRKAG